MKIDLTKKQFRKLLDLVYLGNWIINATRDPDDVIKEYDDLEGEIFSYAEEAGLGSLVDPKAADEKGVHPNGQFEEQASEYIEQYDDETFWEEMATRFAERDFIRDHTADDMRALSQEEWFRILSEYEDDYGTELENHGIDRFEIIDEETAEPEKSN